MKKLFWILPAVAAVITGGAIVMMQERVVRGDPVDLAIDAIDESTPFVRVSGMAHYPVVVKQTVPGRPLIPERTLYLFPLFGPHDTEGRAIKVLVRAERPPDELVSYEYMTLEGHVTVPTPDKVPYATEIALGKRSDYFFTDDMVLLEPWRIEVEGEPAWELDR